MQNEMKNTSTPNLNTFPLESLQSIKASFLSLIYDNISKRSKNQFNMYTLYELCSFPIVVCNKLINVFASGSNNALITKEQFIEGFIKLYSGTLKDKTILIGQLCDFSSQRRIWINDVKILLLHFHMQLFSNETEGNVIQIINAFYSNEEDKKNDFVISVEDFVNRSLKTNGDIMYLFIVFFEKMLFYNKEQISYYKNISQSKEKDNEDIDIPIELLSSKAISYAKMIKETKYEVNPFNDDCESLSNLSTFENDLSETICIINNQIDYSMKDTFVVPQSEKQRYSASFTERAKEFFSLRTNESQSLKSNYINPLRKNNRLYHQNELIVSRQSAKTKKMKLIKLMQIGNMLFYHKYNQTNQLFEFKKIIVLKLLFTKILPNILLPNGTYFQLILQSSIHNHIFNTIFYSQNEDELTHFAKEINAVQRIRNIEDDYEIGEKLGSGKFGKVVLAKHIVSGREVAIKMVAKNDNEHSEETFHSYKWEKDICSFLKNVSNDFVEKCYDVLETPNYLYYVTEYIPGENLKGLITQSSGLSSYDVNDICIQMIKGLSFLHQYGIIHRDIKHTNTLVNRNHKGKISIKIIDFGLSKVMGMNETTSEHYGSLSFKAPELIMGKPYSFGVDVWALGITAYYLVFQKFPVKASNKHQLKKKIVNFNYATQLFENKGAIDPYLANIITRSVIKDPKKRYSITKLLRSISEDND